MKHKETVLLVEDDATVRSVLSEQLSGFGYRCIAAANAIDATQIIEANLFQLDLLVTDIKMPGALDGLALAEKVRALQPDVAILLISGYPDAPVMTSADAHGYRVLAKPFRQSQLEAAVAEELGRRGASVVSLDEARDKNRS
ncbi:MAG TPA: response regulator [Stellaceae bacterium]|nr:response regulator [Stellaceae bacterium]